MSAAALPTDLQLYLDELVARHDVVGAALAVLTDGQLYEFASGRGDVRLAAPMTTESLCLVGSTTKVLTATLVMQLVDEGVVALDDPVRRFLPEARIADSITVEQLLSHTSGMDLGPYSDYGRGDDAVARYVAELDPGAEISRPGERWGYSNAGYVVAGRLIEVLRGTNWDEAMRQCLLGPAGLAQSATLPEHALLHPLSLPHLNGAGSPAVCATWGIAGRAMGPTGSTLAMSAGDLVRFARLHLAGGIGSEGSRVLSSDSVLRMRQACTEVTPGSPFADHWGLGWYAADWGGVQMWGHSGHNLGAGSHLAVFPDQDGALGLVFNTIPGDAGLHHELFSTLSGDLFGASKPDPWFPVTELSDDELSLVTGRYACSQFCIEIKPDGHAIEVAVTGSDRLKSPPRRLRPVLDGRAWGSGELGAHAAAAPPGQVTPELFLSAPDPCGRPQFAHLSVFATRRIDDK